MAVDDRLCYLIRRAKAGHLTRIALSYDVASGRSKAKVLSGETPGIVPDGNRIIAVAALNALRQNMTKLVVVDRGHRHSTGLSETCFWMSTPERDEGTVAGIPSGEEVHHSLPCGEAASDACAPVANRPGSLAAGETMATAHREFDRAAQLEHALEQYRRSIALKCLEENVALNKRFLEGKLEGLSLGLSFLAKLREPLSDIALGGTNSTT